MSFLTVVIMLLASAVAMAMAMAVIMVVMVMFYKIIISLSAIMEKLDALERVMIL